MSFTSKAQFKVVRSYEEQEKIMIQKEKSYQDSVRNAQLKASYDSLENTPVKEAVYGIVGQKLMVKPYHMDYRAQTMVKFFVEPNIHKIYKSKHTKEVYYKNEWDYGFKFDCTDYSAVKDRIFTVTKIIKSSDSRYVFIELTDENGSVYYRFDIKTSYPDFPFNIEGYISKLTEIEKNEKWSKTINYGDDTGIDFYTGKKIKFVVGQIWKLKEIVINPDNGDLIKLYENDKGEVIGSNSYYATFKTKKESDRIKAKYGVSTWKAIMTFSIFIGMSESALIESWGQPEEINYSSYGEQWVYTNGYVYLRNGKVTGWN